MRRAGGTGRPAGWYGVADVSSNQVAATADGAGDETSPRSGGAAGKREPGIVT